jgi:hypothetical protein
MTLRPSFFGNACVYSILTACHSTPFIDAFAAGAGAHLTYLSFYGACRGADEVWTKKLYDLLESNDYICPKLAKVNLTRNLHLNNKFEAILIVRRNK